jgi:hypothetical protein
MNQILCSISTKGRTHTTLPLALSSVINQTRPPNLVMIMDDNVEPEDLREISMYKHLFFMMENKGIEWSVIYGHKKGQHHNHQYANTLGVPWVWRVDDDVIVEPNVLQTLESHIQPDVGAIGGSVYMPPNLFEHEQPTGRIANIDQEASVQWTKIHEVQQVEHLHCTFLYRAGVADYNLGLSKVAHREETLFTYSLFQKGYRLLAVPHAACWHLKSPQGGIRQDTNYEMFARDDEIFHNFMQHRDRTIVVLNCGMGDHIVFTKVLPHLHDPIVFSCYPEIIPGLSIAEAEQKFGSIEQWSIYKKMDQWKWTHSLEAAFRKLYLGRHA